MPRPAVSQFADYEQSADWEALKSVQQVQSEKPGYGVVSVNTEQCVARGQAIKYTPTIDCEGNSVNPAHVDIVGDKGVWPADSLKTARWFANQCAKLVVPEK